MFTEIRRHETEREFQSFLGRLGKFGDYIVGKMGECSDKESAVMKYLYITMPYSDVANYSFETYLDYTRHGIYLWENSPLVKGLPAFIFLNYILHYRVHKEEVVPCRSFFYNELKDIVCDKFMEGSSVEKTILDVNNWCAGEAQYQGIDGRFAPALEAGRADIARSEEESIFTVHALRSIGIPARQAYAPYWSHCDENHVWVETYADGEWKFLGACEPEETLNRGWFIGAAARAVLIQSRLFLPPGYQEKIEGEEVIGKEGCVTILNQTYRYADIKRLTIHAVNEKRKALPGTEVVVQVFNCASFKAICKMTADKEGTISICLGMGTIRLMLRHGSLIAEKDINIDRQIREVIMLKKWEKPSGKTVKKEVYCIAPKHRDSSGSRPEESRESLRGKRLAATHSHRMKKEHEIVLDRERKSLAKLFQSLEKRSELKRIITGCRNNLEELERFLKQAGSPSDRILRLELLSLFPEKDLRDFQADILEDHISHAQNYRNVYPKEIFLNYLLNPRIGWEVVRPYRKGIKKRLGEARIEVFRIYPRELLVYVNYAIEEEEIFEYPGLITTPVECLNLGKAGKLSKDILAVAAFRTIGIPARLHPEDRCTEYYLDGKFHRLVLEAEARKRLILEFKGEEWVYGKNWSLSFWDGIGNNFKMLDFPGIVPNKEHKKEFRLWEGVYRLFTANRLPNGDVRVTERIFYLKDSARKRITMRSIEPKDMLVQVPLPEFWLKDGKGGRLAPAILKEHASLVIWLDDGKSPTEHILNELCGHQAVLQAVELKIIFVLPKPKDRYSAALEKALQAFPDSLWYADDEGTIELLARRMYVTADQRPLMILTDGKGNGIYGASGYHVGIGMTLIKLYDIWSKNESGR